MHYRFISWNVNGLRAALKKGALEFFKTSNSDIIALQEIKVDALHIPEELSTLNYQMYINQAKKKGYSGVLTLSRLTPISIKNGIGSDIYDDEGRVQTLEFDKFYFINAYFPNAQRNLERLDYKLKFNDLFLNYTETLRNSKPVIICGDFNVAHTEIDIARPKDNVHNAGFTKEERNWMSRFLAHSYVDTFRLFINDGGHYTWWSYRFHARIKNIGWRIDYFIITSDLVKNVQSSTILSTILGSDHAPVQLEIEI